MKSTGIKPLAAGLAWTIGCLGLMGPASAQGEATKTAEAQVTLKDAGSGEKREVRYEFEQGDKAEIVMKLEMSTIQIMGGQEMPAQVMPRMIIGVEHEVVGVSGDEYQMKSTITMVDVESRGGVDPMMVNAVRQQIAPLKGTSVTWSMDGLGRIDKLDPDATNPALQQVANTIRNSTLRLPKEPIGEGAVWAVKETMDGMGMEIEQAVTYTLEELSSNRAVVSFDLKQHAGEQDIESEQLPPGAKLRLESMDGDGKGEVTVILDEPAPMDGSFESGVDAKMQMDMNGQQMQMGQKVKTKGSIGRATEGGEDAGGDGGGAMGE